jgi:hypothetical protein
LALRATSIVRQAGSAVVVMGPWALA